MFYENLGFYIKKNILFDVNDLNIYKVDDLALLIIEKLCSGEFPDEYRNNLKYKLLFDRYLNVEDKKMTKEKNDKIRNLQIKVSNTCNMNCTYCYANAGNYGKDDCIMSLDMAKKIADNINDFFPELEKISFFGGEPLMNIDAIEILIENIQNDNIEYSMVTNGTLWNEKIKKLLENHNIKLIVSVDGPKEINDLNRVLKNGKGSYDLIKRNIERFQSHNNSVGMIAAVYTKKSFKQYTREEICELLYKEFLVNVIGVGDVFTDIEELELDSLEKQGLEKAKLVDYTFKKIASKKFFPINIVSGIISSIFNKATMKSFCGAGQVSLFIDEEANIFPCQLFLNDDNYCMGSLLSSNKRNIFDNENYVEVRNRLDSVNKEEIKTCEKCLAKFWCFKCIGQGREKENFGACSDEQDCNYNKEITALTLDKISSLINGGGIDELIDGINYLSGK